MPEYYEKNSRNGLLTAPKIVWKKKRVSSLNRDQQLSDSQRFLLAKTSHGNRNNNDHLVHTRKSDLRTGTAATYEMSTFSPTYYSKIFKVNF